MENKKFFIKTYGCGMNFYDSDNIKNIMQGMKMDEVQSHNDADVIILNTCAIREKATEKVYSDLGRINRYKQERLKNGQNTIIAVTGCVAQAEGEEIFNRSPFVDIVAGPETYHSLKNLINDAQQNKTRNISLDFEPDKKFDYLEGENFKGTATPSAYVTIQEGCDQFCTFCVVPYTRGPEFSRVVEKIIDEIKILADNGTKEIVLLGQNVNAYHGLDSKGRVWKLSQLISKIAEIDGIERIRYTTSHPCDMTDDLIAVHGSENKLMPLLNLPVQSGSDAILKKMNRKYTRDEYIAIIEKLRKVRPDIILSSDFIIGFPGESDKDFEDTVDLIKTIKFYGQSYSFKYSPRPGTPAFEKEQIDEAIKTERLDIVQKLLEQQRLEFNNQFLDREVKILFDNSNSKRKDQISGRTEFSQIGIINVPNSFNPQRIIGNVLSARVNIVNPNSFTCNIDF